MEEMGRVLLVAPYFSTIVLAGQTLTTFDDDTANATWLPRIADGSLTATLALAEESGSWELDSVEATAQTDGAGYALSGVKMFVPDGDSADLLLVVARVCGELGLFAVDGSARGVQRRRLEALDLTRPLARIEFAAAPAERILPRSGSATTALRHALDLAIVGLAAEQVGGAQRCLDMAVDYAKVRVQFGRPIGSFQAIKHKCADMLLKVEFARSAAYYAGSALADEEVDADIAAALAGAYCSDAYSSVAKANIQVHGGIGFTWEHDSHLYLKRAKSSELLFGTPADERERIADLVGI
jgi:alkylation response protein AidB-like acyl-CoA dehydrogenase